YQILYLRYLQIHIAALSCIDVRLNQDERSIPAYRLKCLEVEAVVAENEIIVEVRIRRIDPLQYAVLSAAADLCVESLITEARAGQLALQRVLRQVVIGPAEGNAILVICNNVGPEAPHVAVDAAI